MTGYEKTKAGYISCIALYYKEGMRDELMDVASEAFDEAYRFGRDPQAQRAQFAAMAMQGILSNRHQVDYACSDVYGGEMPKAVAQYAVACADALISELKKEAK